MIKYFFTSSYVNTVFLGSTSGKVLSTSRKSGLTVNFAFLSVMTCVEMLAVCTSLVVGVTETRKIMISYSVEIFERSTMRSLLITFAMSHCISLADSGVSQLENKHTWRRRSRYVLLTDCCTILRNERVILDLDQMTQHQVPDTTLFYK